MAAIKLRYVERFTDRHGHVRYYFRRRRGPRTPLPGLPGSSGFMAAYQTALSAKPAGGAVDDPRSFNALVKQYFRSPSFLKLRPSSQYCTRNVMERLAAEHGHGSIPDMTRWHIEEIVGAKAATPAAANTYLKRLRTLLNYAIALGWRENDPTKGVSKFAEGEYHTWDEAELARFEAKWRIGTRERTAYTLALYTGQRRADVCRMTWADIVDGKMRLVQSKTRAKLEIPLHAALRTALEAWPRSHMTIIVSSRQAQYTVESFGNLMADAIAAAGLPPRCVLHGLRKAAARRLAEAGCSASQIASITGHKSLEEVERYTRAASQSQMATDAILKLPVSRVGTTENKQ